jgi:hypothetical protein
MAGRVNYLNILQPDGFHMLGQPGRTSPDIARILGIGAYARMRKKSLEFFEISTLVGIDVREERMHGDLRPAVIETRLFF